MTKGTNTRPVESTKKKPLPLRRRRCQQTSAGTAAPSAHHAPVLPLCGIWNFENAPLCLPGPLL